MSELKTGGGNSDARNPFEPRQQTTVRRATHEVYPQGTDLSKPQFLGDSPLDKLFQKLERDLEVNLDDITLSQLERVFLDTKTAGTRPENEVRYGVVEALFHQLQQISELSLLTNEDHKEKNLISISLHDMKTFSKVVNLIIMYGVYPATSAFGIGIAIEKRRMGAKGGANFKTKDIKPIPPASVGDKWSFHLRLLELIYNRFSAVFSIESDVRSLLLKGTGFSDFLVTTLTLATVPEFSDETRAEYLNCVKTVTTIPSTFELYQVYSVLLSSPCPPFFRSFVLKQLQDLPSQALKGDGVLSLIEFVMGLRDSESISMEKIDQVSDILILKPKDIPSVQYFSSIGSQCYDLLININRPIITSAVTHFINRLWFKNSRIVQDFIFKKIQMCFAPVLSSEDTVLVSETALNNAVNILVSISRLTISSEALSSLFAPIWLDMWSYYTFLKQSSRPSGVFEDVLINVIESLGLDSQQACEMISRIGQNLSYDNGNNLKYRLGPNQLVEIARAEEHIFKKESPEKRVLRFVTNLETGVDSFIGLLKRLNFDFTQKLFITLLSKWASPDASASLEVDPFIKLTDLKLLERIATEFNEELSKTPFDTLVMMHSIIRQLPTTLTSDEKSSLPHIKSEPDQMDVDSDDEDEAVAVASGNGQNSEVQSIVFDLLAAIVLEISSALLDARTKAELESICTSLQNNSSSKAATLVTQIMKTINGQSVVDDERASQRHKLNRALANINDPLVPVKAQGLSMLRELIEDEAKVISVDFVIKTHITQLSDPDPFVYMNAIRGLESLLAVHSDDVLPLILQAYSGRDKNFSSVDDRLKLGEALLRYIQIQGKALSGASAHELAQCLLKMVRVSSLDEEKTDDHLRMSAMSLLGMCFKTNTIGVLSSMREGLDCAIGILQFETSEKQAIMRRSALVLIHDMIMGTSMSDKTPFPTDYQQKTFDIVSYVKEHDKDILTREQAASVLSYIEELAKLGLAQD